MAEVIACSVDFDIQDCLDELFLFIPSGDVEFVSMKVSRNSSHFWDQKPNKRGSRQSGKFLW
ncbi:hypothetical protein SLEP1_g7328 [Rubroshorea leprosula]|uniref:Uncharacterized protein n=1 Tax=Rubroshorea leprosula TaxID=152421 RepID=A0AAV5I8Z0_9ROSI|nr:hypothetical protein SLEP1_g7328 [Rubroshorea leprosula]